MQMDIILAFNSSVQKYINDISTLFFCKGNTHLSFSGGIRSVGEHGHDNAVTLKMCYLKKISFYFIQPKVRNKCIRATLKKLNFTGRPYQPPNFFPANQYF